MRGDIIKWAEMRKIVLCVLVVALAVGAIGGYLLLEWTRTSGTPGKYIGTGELRISSPPALNQTATLTYVIRPYSSYHSRTLASARILLHERLIWVSGGENSVIYDNRYLIENVYLLADEPVKVSGTIKAIRTGRWNIVAFTTEDFGLPPDTGANSPAGGGIAAGATINILVGENSAQVENGWWYSLPTNHENMDFPAAPSLPIGMTLDLSDSPYLDQGNAQGSNGSRGQQNNGNGQGSGNQGNQGQGNGQNDSNNGDNGQGKAKGKNK